MERDITVEFFKCIFGAVSTTIRAPFSPITFEKRKKSLSDISKTGQLTLILSRLINTSTRGKNVGFFGFGVNCPFNCHFYGILPSFSQTPHVTQDIGQFQHSPIDKNKCAIEKHIMPQTGRKSR